jgi:tripartite ATP-independent transporter DctM subunit
MGALAIVLVAAFLAGVPIAFALGLASLTFLLKSNIPLVLIVQRMYTGVDFFPLVAVPLFVFAGFLMETGGISRRIVTLALSIVGPIRGSLGMGAVVSEMIFSGISGSSIADASAMGAILIPTMGKTGYDARDSTAIVAAATGMGILVPPCMAMVVLGGMGQISIGALFAAGFLPAAVMALAICFWIYLQARKGRLPGDHEGFSSSRVWRAFKDALIPLGMPVIIFGGILGGVTTATEAAVLAVLYGFIVSVLIYREITYSQVGKMLVNTGVVTGVILILIGTASIFSWIMANQQVPQMITRFMLRIGEPWLFLLLSSIVILIGSAVLDGLPAIIILYPILLPIAQKLGLDPLHFTLVMVAAEGIGIVLPPVGICLIVVCGVSKVSLSAVTRPLLPYIAVMFLSLLIIMYLPWITLVVPRFFHLY